MGDTAVLRLGCCSPVMADAVEEPLWRPPGLRAQLLRLHGLLAVCMSFFVCMGLSLEETLPEGKFRSREGHLLDLDAYDPVALGPFPRCHPRFNMHQGNLENGTVEWVMNSEAPSGGPYPVGHPDNPEWVAKASEEMRAENQDNWKTWKGLQPILHLLTLSVLCVYLGCKHAVWLSAKYLDKSRKSDPDENGALLTKEDAYIFPIIGSITLFSMFLLLKYLGTDIIKMAITCLVLCVCTFGFGTNMEQIVAVVRSKPGKSLFSIESLELALTPMQILGMLCGTGLAAMFVQTKSWVINNIFGVSFAVLGIKTIGICDFKTGAILLVGLFFYDIFWVFFSKPVFGSNVMVSVAKGVEAPIKLMFPRNVGVCGTLQHSMLGLGDIVVPGLFLAWLAKWDAIRINAGKATSSVYLNVTMASYTLSLITTVLIMLVFQAAQPALLYIVPYILLTSIAVALYQGEFKEMWAYSFEQKAEEKEETEESKKDQ